MVCILSTFCPAPLTGFLLNSGQFNVAVHAEVISNIHLGPGCGGWPGAAAGARAVSWWPPISPRAPPRPTCHVSPRASPTTASHWHWQYTGLGVSCATARDQLSPHPPDPDQDAADQASAPRRPVLPGPGTWVVVPRSGRCGTSSGYSGYSGSNWTHQTQSLAQMSCPTWWIP